MDLFEPGSGSQVHDLNGGILKNGLFWTIQLPGDAFWMNDDRTSARLRAKNVPVIDSFEFAGANVVPATVDLDVWWHSTGPVQWLGEGNGVPDTDAAAFRGRFRRARSTGRFSGTELGFRFHSKPGASTDEGYAEIGMERNGAFL